MSKLEFSKANVDRMVHVQEQIERAVLPFRENTEAAIVVLALMRVARKLLDLYSAKTRGELRDVIDLYLSGDAPAPIHTPTSRLLTKFKLN